MAPAPMSSSDTAPTSAETKNMAPMISETKNMADTAALPDQKQQQQQEQQQEQTESESLPADRLVEEVESLCLNCEENGTTKLLLTRIPFFKDIILMSFFCPHCGFRNSEIQNAGEIQQRGVRYTFRADVPADLQRQLVKSDACIISIRDIELDIPPGRGQLTNIEGLLTMVRQDLERDQPERREAQPEVYAKIEDVIQNLNQLAAAEKFPFTLVVDDPSGNSSIEPSPQDRHGKYVRAEYERSRAQNEALGLTEQEANGSQAPGVDMRPEYRATGAMYPPVPTKTPGFLNVDKMGTLLDNADDDTDILLDEVYSFAATCPGCNRHCVTNMKMVDIPHFKQVILMSTVCHDCGYRSNEVKTGGEVPEKARRIKLQIRDKIDLSRDILKAESCAMECPELELNVEAGTLGGRFTTIEGLLTQVRDDLKGTIFGDEEYKPGDSMQSERAQAWTKFFDKLNSAIHGDIPFTLILSDPLAASYVQSFKAPEPDEQIEVEEYDRTFEEMEDLGLNDMILEGYEQEDNSKKEEEEAAAVRTNESASTEDKPVVDADAVQKEVEEKMKQLADGD